MRYIFKIVVSLSAIVFHCALVFGQYSGYETIFSCDFDHVSAGSTPGGMWRGTPLDPNKEGVSPQKFYNSFDVFALPDNYVETTLNGYAIINEMKHNPNDTGSYDHFVYGFKDHTSGNGYMLICKNWEIAFACKDYGLKPGDKVRFSYYSHMLLADAMMGNIYGIFAIASSKRYDIANTEYNGSVCQNGSDEFCTRDYVYPSEEWEKQEVEYTLNECDSVYFYFGSNSDSYTCGCFDDIAIEVSHVSAFQDEPINSNFSLYKTINFDQIPGKETSGYSRGVELDEPTEGTTYNIFSNDFTSKSPEENAYNIVRSMGGNNQKDHTYDFLRTSGNTFANDLGYYFFGTDYEVDCSAEDGATGDVVYGTLHYNAPLGTSLNVIVENENSDVLFSSDTLKTNGWGWKKYMFSIPIEASGNLRLKVVSADSSKLPFALDDISFFLAKKDNAKLTIIAEPNDKKLGHVDGPGYRFFDGTEKSVTFTAIPNDSVRFLMWSDGGVDPTRTFKSPLSNTNVTAIFQKVQRCLELNAIASDTAFGSVSFDDKCYDWLSVADITATPKRNCNFLGWSDGVKSNNRTVMLGGDTTIVALFEHKPMTTVKVVIKTDFELNVFQTDRYEITSDTTLVFEAVAGENFDIACRGKNDKDSVTTMWEYDNRKFYAYSTQIRPSSIKENILYVTAIRNKSYHVKLQSYNSLGTINFVEYDYNTYPVKEYAVQEADVYTNASNIINRYIDIQPAAGAMAVGFYDENTSTIKTNPVVTSDTVLTYFFAPTSKCALVLITDTTYGHAFLTVGDDTITDNGMRLVTNNTYMFPDKQLYPRVGYSVYGKGKDGYVLHAFRQNSRINVYGDLIDNMSVVGEVVYLEPVFVKKEKKVTVSVVNPECGEVTGVKDSYNYGDSLNIQIIPSAGYEPSYRVSSAEKSTDGNGIQIQEVLLEDEYNIVIEFKKKENTLTPMVTLSSNNPQWGSVTGAGQYGQNELITIKAIPSKDCIFLGWNDGNRNAERTISTGIKDISLIACFLRLNVTNIEPVYSENTSGLVNVYTINGVILKYQVEETEALTNLPKGIYVVGNKLQIKR